MIEKVKFLLTSLRFWQITLAAITAELTLAQAHGFQVTDLLGVITTWLGSIALVGTIDKFSN